MKKGFFILAIMFFSNSLIAQQNDTISQVSSCVEQLYLPNSFHGHGDCINDVFVPRMIGEPQNYSFKIFNRWGELIFETNKVTEGWNGSYKNKAVQTDVYVWMIEFTCKDDEEKYKLTGNVSLLR